MGATHSTRSWGAKLLADLTIDLTTLQLVDLVGATKVELMGSHPIRCILTVQKTSWRFSLTTL